MLAALQHAQRPDEIMSQLPPCQQALTRHQQWPRDVSKPTQVRCCGSLPIANRIHSRLGTMIYAHVASAAPAAELASHCGEPVTASFERDHGRNALFIDRHGSPPAASAALFDVADLRCEQGSRPVIRRADAAPVAVIRSLMLSRRMVGCRVLFRKSRKSSCTIWMHPCA